MKGWQPDSGDGSDPFLGGLFSRRAEAAIGALLLVIVAILWHIWGLNVAGGALLIAVLIWTMVFG